MTECIHPYYLKNGNICLSDTFRLQYINEGKSIYEVTRLAGSGLMFLEDHMDRFFTSLKMEGVVLNFSREDIRAHIRELIRLNKVTEGNVKFVYNSGDEEIRNFLVYFTAHRYPTPEDYTTGVSVITFSFERTDPNKKIWRPFFRSQVADEIKQKSAWEALLIDSQGFMPEASRSNLFAVKGGGVITSPDKYILTGITRKYVLQACVELKIPVNFRLINLDEIAEMDALFLTSTSLQLISVRQVDHLTIPVSDQTTQRITEKFEIIKNIHLKQNHILS